MDEKLVCCVDPSVNYPCDACPDRGESPNISQATRDDLMRRLDWHLRSASKYTSMIHELATVAATLATLTQDALENDHGYTDAELIRVGKELHVLSSLYIIAVDRQKEDEL